MRRPLLAVVALITLASPALAAATRHADAVRAAEARLAELGFWTGRVDGVWDVASRQALIAFQKVEGLPPTGRLTPDVRAALATATPLLPREEQVSHVEVDLARQVLFLVDADGRVANILPISSGSGRTFHEHGYPETHAVTPCGHLAVYARAAGWRRSPLGEMYNPLYIVGGIAIHGSTEMRTYPASHGCIRIPMYAAERLPRLLPTGTPVYVYGCADDSPAAEPLLTVASAVAPSP
jgi:lipoprotein-anchoring transpeptidase ErfK/SrfK